MITLAILLFLIIGVPTGIVLRKGGGWRKVAVVLGITLSSFLVIFVSALLLFIWSCAPPSLTSLVKRFPKQRADLETILAMSSEDKHLLRIDPDWLYTDEPAQYLEYDPKVGITLERWKQYRRLLSGNGITQGIQRQPDSDDAFVMVRSEGLLDMGTSNGYLFCGVRPVHQYAPCTSPLARGEHRFDGGANPGYSFIKLSGGWYAFSLGPG